MNPATSTPASLAWFDRMIPHCREYAEAAVAEGRPIVGIMCEYAPRELIMAAGGVPVCLCGGDADTIPAAEAHLPANLCPLIKSTYGYLVEKSNPFLEMADLVVAETTCDGKKKMFELMAEAKPTYLLELPQKEDDPPAMEHWVRELRKFKHFLEARYRVDITESKLRESVGAMNQERAVRRRLAETMKAEQPALTGRQLLNLKSIISVIPADLDQYDSILKELARPMVQTPIISGPIKKSPMGDGGASVLASRDHPINQRLARTLAPPSCPASLMIGVQSNGGKAPVRVLLTGVPLVHGAERVMEIIESHGGLVVCQENCTGLKPILEDVDPNAPDLIRALAEKYYHLPCSIRTPNHRRMDLLRRLAAEYRAECVIELIWQACLTYAVESFHVKRVVEEELRLPYLRIETDYSPSDSARIATRVEALVETVRAQRPPSAPR